MVSEIPSIAEEVRLELTRLLHPLVFKTSSSSSQIPSIKMCFDFLIRRGYFVTQPPMYSKKDSNLQCQEFKSCVFNQFHHWSIVFLVRFELTKSGS